MSLRLSEADLARLKSGHRPAERQHTSRRSAPGCESTGMRGLPAIVTRVHEWLGVDARCPDCGALVRNRVQIPDLDAELRCLPCATAAWRAR